MRLPLTTRMFDPICGMWLEPGEVGATYTYIGQTYGFCSEECRNLFARAPDRHVVRLAHDPEAHTAHRCPVQERQLAVGASHMLKERSV